MIKNLKLRKKLISGLLITSMLGTGIGAYKIYTKYQYNRVKKYVEDFLTEDNYVDLTKISTNYNIKCFNGKILHDVLEDFDIDYVRIADSYICDDNIRVFKQVNATNYDKVLWEDKEGNKYYEMYEPMRDNTEFGVSYYIPEGFCLEETECYVEPIKYDELYDYVVDVIQNNYEDSYSLSLERKR